jgi:hypothetical protein
MIFALFVVTKLNYAHSFCQRRAENFSHPFSGPEYAIVSSRCRRTEAETPCYPDATKPIKKKTTVQVTKSLLPDGSKTSAL